MNTVLVVVVLMTGWFSQYAPGKMEEVILNHQTPGVTAVLFEEDLSEYSVFIAVDDCSSVGKEVLVRFKVNGQYTEWEKGLISDCSGDAQTSKFLAYYDGCRRCVIGEIDGKTAIRLNTVRFGIEGQIAILVSVKDTDYVAE